MAGEWENTSYWIVIPLAILTLIVVPLILLAPLIILAIFKGEL